MQRITQLFALFNLLVISSAITFTPLVHFQRCQEGALSAPTPCQVIQWFRFATEPGEEPQTVQLVSKITGEPDLVFATITTDETQRQDFSRNITLCPPGSKGGSQTIVAQSQFVSPDGKVLASASDSITVSCPGGVSRDPKFYGFDGEVYFVKGENGKTYSLISEKHIQVNALFDQHGLFYQHQTFMQKIGIVVADEYFISIDSNAQITVNDESYDCESLELESEFMDLYCTLEGRSAVVELLVPGYKFSFFAKEGGTLINLQASLRQDIPLEEREIHGLLGQTADRDGVARKGLPHSQQGEGWIEGTYEDYEVTDLFASDFSFNRYDGEKILFDD